MIRSALFALGLTAGGLGAAAAQAQGMVATAPILETCGGLRVVLEPLGTADDGEIERASDVVSARMGGVFSQIFDYTIVQNDAIVVSLPQGFGQDLDPLTPLLEQVNFGFYDVEAVVFTDAETTLSDDQVLMRDAHDDTRAYVLAAQPVLDGAVLKDAQASFDMNNRPAVAFSFTDEGAQIFENYTADNIGEPFAIVLRNQVMSAPTILTVIAGGEGIITGNFTQDEAMSLAAVMQGGVLPFSLDIIAVDVMDGSDPSADFCP